MNRVAKLRMNWRRLQNVYRCQSDRGKSHYQMALELLAKLANQLPLSSTFMVMSLQRHGLGSDIGIRDRDIIERSGRHLDQLERDEILTGRFFLDLTDDAVWARYRITFSDKIETVIKDAETICRHEFDLLGSGLCSLGQSIDWHVDPVTGYRWPKKLFSELKATSADRGSDIKLPWELSRMQHLPTLGKAYRLTKDDRYAKEVVGQITHWLHDNPCPYGVNWTCAMDVAIRIMNIAWAYLLVADASVVTNEFRWRLKRSIFQHGQFILFNLEYSLRKDGSITNGNHYLADVIGLLHLGLLCPELEQAARWKAFGARALVEEMERQVYPDGANFESSLAYHRLVLELFTAGALLCRNNGVMLPDPFWQRLERMYEFVLLVTRPDGKAPQVGDADDGRLYILSDYGAWERSDLRYLLSIGAVLFKRGDMKAHADNFSEEAFWLLGPPGMDGFAAIEKDERDLRSTALRYSGLYVMRSGRRYLLACCGEVGTAGIGNHKHNDLLSFELYADDKAFIVDPGAYVYTRTPELRNLFRSTKYHNTVVIDGQEQNRFEVDNLFAMTADSCVIVHDLLSTPERDWLDVEHTGYSRLTNPVQHRRTFLFEKANGKWTITDILTGVGEHRADWYCHFDHGIQIAPVGGSAFQTRSEGMNITLSIDADISLVFGIEDGWVSRRYGHRLTAKILHIHGTFRSACRLMMTIRLNEAPKTICPEQLGAVTNRAVDKNACLKGNLPWPT